MRVIFLFLSVVLAASAVSSQNQNISNGLVFEGEPYLAVNPENPQHMVVAWMGFVFGQSVVIKTRTTFNGGQSWSAVKSLPHFQSDWGSADPSLAFGPGGTVYACYIDYKESPPAGNVYVFRSDDGGLNWGNPAVVINVSADGTDYPIDRPWLVVDRSGGPNNGNLYVTTKPAPWVPAPNRPYFMRSTDGNASWSDWEYLDGPGALVGNYIAAPMAAPAVAADGTLYAMYPSWVVLQNILPGFILAKSTDGGANFTYKFAYGSATPASDTLAKLGYRLFADPSDPLHLGFVFLQKNAGDLDVAFLETTDGGANWLPPVRVNDDAPGNGKMQDLVWGDFDLDGDLVISWRDRRNAPGTGYQQASEAWAAVRWKDATAFSANFPLSDGLTEYNDVFLSQPGNDFMGVAMANDTISAVWGDVRNGKLNIYFQRKALQSGSSSVQQLSEEALPQVAVYPNPTSGELVVRGSGLLGFRIMDTQGRVWQSQATDSDEFRTDVGAFPAGVYFVCAKTAAGDVPLKFIKN